ncbi:MAG: type I methionyl aminopeptidase [bacterium]|nr:type I methionyl aminopeptidase [Acidimicrobiia bacterium]MCY4651372.1 type I methionyl aminopeptidase [bacterium]
MITFKTPAQFKRMEVAGRCVAKAHQAVREAARTGLTTIELNEVAERVIRGEGCVPSFLGYRGFPASICSSPNDVIVHGIPDLRRLRSGDLLSVDIGAIYEGFHADAACTFGVGELSSEASALSATTKKALWAGLRQARPGMRIGDIGAAVEAVARPKGYGVVEGYVGHGIGRQMHEKPDVPNVGRAGKGVKLRVGMALCVEPMFNLGGSATRVDPDGWTVRTADKSLSAHWEHTVALTPDGPLVTTNSALVDLLEGARSC